jgi:hypothetical protein
MKELEFKSNRTNIELSVEQRKQVQYQFIGDIVPHEGHKIWEINTETLEVKEAKFSNTTYQMFGENKKEIIVKKGFAYVAALNKKNALKKYKNGVSGGKQLGNEKLPM